MKKYIYSLIALVFCMSINAQSVIVLKNGTTIAAYTNTDDLKYKTIFEGAAMNVYENSTLKASYSNSATDTYKVVFYESITGSAKATVGASQQDVEWVQLWENGPKFATINVGATSLGEYGDYYSYTQASANPWGTNWRMPTKDECEALKTKCDYQWTDNYNGSGKKGFVCVGKGLFAKNSIFLPAAGYNGAASQQEVSGNYLTSTMYSSNNIYYFAFRSTTESGLFSGLDKSLRVSFRAVLNEKNDN